MGNVISLPCKDCRKSFCECAWIDVDTEQGDGPEEFLEVENGKENRCEDGRN